ncbi:ATP-binding protein [Blastomonas sp. UPD001]|jgi:signal transduction histidine kinase/CheY-like chemotaxis protein|uniref:ATP-binding protein n=1 Tax=Blastomonas sp. UPD001 TaxID=2217673 RepID=UPI000E343AC4|nr:ATP-binding protein [Blastomonas sp. UPD001]
MLKRLAIATGWARRTRRSPALRIGIAIAAFVVGVGGRLALDAYLTGVPYITLFAAIVMAAFFAGFWPAMLATVLGAITLEVLIMPSVALARPDDLNWLPTTLFLLTSLMISLIIESVFRAHDDRLAVAEKLAQLNAGLDGLVAERTAQLEQQIAERQVAESRLHQAEKLDAIGHLTGGIAHDFNNMLAIITGSLDLAKRRLGGQVDPRIVSHIDNAANAAERAAALTHRLLAYARKQPLDPRRLDINALVGSVHALLERTLGEQVVVDLQLDADVWPCLADQTQMETAIINLAVNARDAMPDGGKLVIETANVTLDDRYCRAQDDLGPGDYVRIAISDTGIGMSPEVQARALDPFFTTKDVGKGTGLGLSQVYGFLKQSGGHLNLYSEEGKGTTVKLYLPRAAEAEAEDGRSSQTTMRFAPPQNLTVLVVEDDDGVRAMARASLIELGFVVHDVDSPIEAVQLIENGLSVDLLFTDVVMPHMNGRQLADRLRETRPELKVLYTTGYTRNAILHNGVIDSDVVLLVKPYSVDDLARKIIDALGPSLN